MEQTLLLTLSCPNRPGIVAAVSACLFRNGGDILEANQFDDTETNRFFMRVAFAVDREPHALYEAFEVVASEFAMHWQLRPLDQRLKTLILISKSDHCLVDLLYRWRIGELNIDLVGVASNHPRQTWPEVDLGDIPFTYLPIEPAGKAAQEQQLMELIATSGADLVVLARYMQVLSSDLVAAIGERCINIHHGFLPGFKGARPYHQAHERGVKVIGATAHYVTEDLDEGPIIEQDVERISHSDSVQDLIRRGRDIERRVLARAVALHAAGRVFPNGKRTVVFRD